MSRIRLYFLCPRRFYYAYGEGIFEPETPETRFGTYLHAVIEKYVRHLLETSRSKDVEVLFSIARSESKDYPLISKEGPLSLKEADFILNRFASKRIDPRRVFALEKFFKLKLSPNSTLPIEGRIDRIDLLDSPGRDPTLHIIDYKSGKHKLTAGELANDIQLKMYMVAAFHLYRKSYSRFRFSLFYLRDSSIVSHSEEWSDDLQSQIEEIINEIASDREFRKIEGPRCKYCPAFNTCRPESFFSPENKL